MRKTGRHHTACKCSLCKLQCRTHCLGTPDDIRQLLKAGYKERLEPTLWCVGMVLGKIPYPVRMVQARMERNGCCTFFRDGLCELHDLGLKPTEGRLSHHTLTKENTMFSRSLSWNVAKEWLDEGNSPVIEEIARLIAE